MKWRREDIEITFPYQGICFFQLIDPKFQFRFVFACVCVHVGIEILVYCHNFLF